MGNMSYIRRLPSWSFTVIAVMVILYLTLVPRPLPDNDIRWWKHSDKIAHALMFGFLYMAVYIDCRRQYLKISAVTMAVTALVIIFFGGMTEVLQQIMAMGRGGDVYDWLADVAGVVFALLLCRFLNVRSRR